MSLRLSTEFADIISNYNEDSGRSSWLQLHVQPPTTSAAQVTHSSLSSTPIKTDSGQNCNGNSYSHNNNNLTLPALT